jgi:hypothetical protein
MLPKEMQGPVRRFLRFIGPSTKWLGAAVLTAIITAVVGLYVHELYAHSKPAQPKQVPPKTAKQAPAFCTIRGIEDSGFLNAALTGRSSQVAAIAVWIVDEGKWYFQAAQHNGQTWSAPADSTHLWEIGQPGDPPQTSFIFAMLTRTPHAHDRLPGEEEGRRTIPQGFMIAGEQIPFQQRDLLRGGYNRRC